MERITLSVDDSLARQFEGWMARQGYVNRSEAFRDLLRQQLDRESIGGDNAGHCVGSATYLFDHHERQLTRRLTEQQHAHHDLCLATQHVHIDHDACLETTLLRGPTAAVRKFANALIAERGVRHGHVHLVPVKLDISATHHPAHMHLTPAS